MHRWKLILLTGVVALLLATAAAALWGPGLLRDRATAWVSAETGRTLTIGKVTVNLLTLSVEVSDLLLTETDRHTPFIAWKQLRVALSPRSLWHRAPVISELHLEQPEIRLERRPDGRFNFSDLLDRKTDEPTEPSTGESARFSLNNLTIAGGRVAFVDQTLEQPATHLVEGLELAVPFVGNLPYLADRYVQPLLRATVNGTPLELRGELKPFADTQEYALKLTFDGIDLPYYLGYLPEPLPVIVNKGRLDIDLDLTYRAAADAKPVLELAGRCDLRTLDLRERDGRPLLFFPLLEARLAPSRPLDRNLHLASVTIDNLQNWVTRNPAGEWNVARLGEPAATQDNAPAKEREPPPPLHLRIDRLHLKNGRLELRDQLPAGGFATTLQAINLEVDGFTLDQDTPFKLALDLASERQEQLNAQGQITLSPLALDLRLKAAAIPLDAYRPYYQDAIATPVGGTAAIDTHLQLFTGQPLLLSDSRIELNGLDLPFGQDEGFHLTRAVLRDGRLDLAARQLQIAGLDFEQPELRVSRAKDGHWSFHHRGQPAAAETVASPAMQAAPANETPPFSWRVDAVSVRDGRVAFRDEQPTEPARFDMTGLEIRLHDLGAPGAVTGSFDLRGNFQKAGRFQASGTVVPDGPAVTAALQLRRIPLPAFAPYLGEQVRMVLVDGLLDTDLTASVAKQKETWRGRFGGSLGVSRFYCLDADHREDLLRWERLQISGIDGHIEPFSLRVAAMTLNDYYARLLIDEQARLNFAQLAVKKTPAAPEAPPAEQLVAASPAPTPEALPPKPEIRIGKITLQNGKINFSDRHMARPFTAEMLQLGGRIEGLSSAPGTRAEVDLRGRLRNESPLTIAGTLNPLADPLFLDLKLGFTDIELSPLSPYSGTYVGYLIERGKLNVALEYQVENGQLKASNKLFIDQFTFGEQVASDKATSLPVRLAVTLLKDRNGEIHLDIPVHGDINDPRFSLWGIIWQVIRNLLAKAATSPLALLGALAGSGEDFSAIVFPSGSSVLTEPEQTKLKKITEVLRDRPELKIEVRGYADPENDPEGYRRELLQARLRREKLLDLRKRLGEAAPADADGVVVAAEEVPAYLWRVYQAADFPKPRNLVGLVKHLPDAELEKLLLANTRVGQEELMALAQARAAAVVASLTAPGGIPRERVFLATADFTAQPATAGASRSRVEFGMAVR